MKRNRIIIAVLITLVLSALSIKNLYKKDVVEEQKETTTTTIVEETTNTTTTTQTTSKTTKKTIKKITTRIIKYNENEMTTYLYQEVLNRGWNQDDYNAAVNIIIKESGFNPNSVNKSSGACGLFQAHPCKKAIKQYPDYMTNYKSQIKWGLDYIKGRYGTPTKAWNFWQQHKWY